jgi:hypothetical protein
MVHCFCVAGAVGVVHAVHYVAPSVTVFAGKLCVCSTSAATAVWEAVSKVRTIVRVVKAAIRLARRFWNWLTGKQEPTDKSVSTVTQPLQPSTS